MRPGEYFRELLASLPEEAQRAIQEKVQPGDFRPATEILVRELSKVLMADDVRGILNWAGNLPGPLIDGYVSRAKSGNASVLAFPDFARPLLEAARGGSQESVIDGILPGGVISCIYGQPGSFKSALAVSWAVHVAFGVPWYGRECLMGAVLWFGAEGIQGLASRYEAVRSGLGLPDAWLPILQIDPSDFLYGSGLDRRLSDLRQWSEGNREPVRLIVIDTLSDFALERDLQWQKDMDAVLGQIRRMHKQFPDSHVLIIHHSNRKDSGEFGSFSLRRTVDMMYSASRKGERAVLREVKPLRDGTLAFPPSISTEAVKINGSSTIRIKDVQFSSQPMFREAGGAKATKSKNGSDRSTSSRKELKQQILKQFCGSGTFDKKEARAFLQKAGYSQSQAYRIVKEIDRSPFHSA